MHVSRSCFSANTLWSLSLNWYFTGTVQNVVSLSSDLSVYCLVLEPKNSMFVTRLVMSSMTATASWLGTGEFLPSTLAAMDVKARVAFSCMVALFMIGLLPMLRLKHRVERSASLMASQNFLTLFSSLVSTFLEELARVLPDPLNLPLSSAWEAYRPPASFFRLLDFSLILLPGTTAG